MHCSEIEDQQWEELQARVLAQLPSGAQPTNTEVWTTFQKSVLAHKLLRPIFQPSGAEEWAQFRECTLAHFLARSWYNSACVTLIMEKGWSKFEELLSPNLQPLTAKEWETKVYTLRCKPEIGDEDDPNKLRLPEDLIPYSLYPDLNGSVALVVPKYEAKREDWQKKLAWRIASQHEAECHFRKERIERTNGTCELDPMLRMDLLLAVQVATEDEREEETKWREQIILHLPDDLRPTSEQQWMRLDCRVLSQMPLQPRLNTLMEITDEWRAIETSWKEWEKLTAKKLLERRSVKIREEDLDRFTPEALNLPQWEYEWRKRIIAQMPPSVRPVNSWQWTTLEMEIVGRLQIELFYGTWEAKLNELEDWEKMIIWMKVILRKVMDEEQRQASEYFEGKAREAREKEALRSRRG